MGAETFGAEGTMWIQWERMQKNPGVHPEPTGGGSGGGPDITEGVHGPVYG